MARNLAPCVCGSRDWWWSSMSASSKFLSRLARAVQATGPTEVFCDEAAVLMAQCAAAQLSEAEAQRQYPALWHHFHFCADCAAEYALLMEVVQAEAAGQLPSAPPVPPLSQLTRSKPRSPATSKTTDHFHEAIKASLEHAYEVGWEQPAAPLSDPQRLRGEREAAWLGDHSPLATPYFLGAQLADQPPTPARYGAALRACLWRARDQLPLAMQDLLNASYFRYMGRARPTHNNIALSLNQNQATYFRRLKEAVIALGEALLARLAPPLGAEALYTPWLMGRAETLAQVLNHLHQGRNVTLIGPSGVGKTTLGMALAQGWQPAPALWFTLQAGANDQLETLIFTLGHFLQTLGVSALWQQLVASGHRLNPVQAQSLVRRDLDQLPKRLLLCLDEAHLWQTGTAEGKQVLDFLRAIQHPQLVRLSLTHQQPLFAEDEVCPLAGLALTSLSTWPGLEALTPTQLAELHTLTAGHPALVRLVVAFIQASGAVEMALHLLQIHPSASTLLEHLWQHYLSPAEKGLLLSLAVFRRPSPLEPWAANADTLAQLRQRELVQELRPGELSLRPEVQAFVLAQITPADRPGLHLQAAQVRAAYGNYTAAMYHYCAAQEPALAVWAWYHHRRSETARGQAPAARQLLRAIKPSALPKEADRQCLAVLLAEQADLLGEARVGQETLHAVHWPIAAPLTPYARQLAGRLSVQQGQINRALKQFREAAASTTFALEKRRIYLHFEQANLRLSHQRDSDAARWEIALARVELETLEGHLAENESKLTEAQTHYQMALALAEQAPNALEAQAHAHSHLGRVASYLHQLESARAHYAQSQKLFQALGQDNPAMTVLSNLVMTNLQAGYYAEALTQAQTALAFFGGISSYWEACNAANASEACYYLGRYDEAVQYAEQSLHTEETHFAPYSLTTLGRVAQTRQNYAEAESYYARAIAEAQTLRDLWAEAYAWRASGENTCAAGQMTKAAEAFSQAIDCFTRFGALEEVALTQAAQARCATPD